MGIGKFLAQQFCNNRSKLILFLDISAWIKNGLIGKKGRMTISNAYALPEELPNRLNKLYCFGFCGCFLVFVLICHVIKSSSQRAPVSELYYRCVESSAHIEELCNYVTMDD